MILNIINIIIFIFILGILVLIHEIGHFVAAKKCGMVVEEFGVGFPPRLFSKIRKGTLYSINLFPLGGFVKIKGEHYEEDEESGKNPKLFYNRPLGARVIVVIAGVIMNLIFGWFILAIGFSFGFPSLSRDLSQISGAEVIRQEVIVAQVNKNSAAGKAGIKAGSAIISSEGITFKTLDQVQKFSKNHQGKEVVFLIKDLDNNFKKVRVKLAENDAPLGIVIIPDNLIRFSPEQAFWEAAKETASIVGLTGKALGSLISDLFVRGKISEQISGPVGIYRATARATEVGFTAVVMIAVILSINLALINIVPFPALDGGKLAFLLIEAIFRKRVIAIHIEQAIEAIGFFLLILFVLAVTYKDIIRIG